MDIINNPNNQNNKTDKPKISPLIHTFRDDANKYIKDKKISLMDIVKAEGFKRNKETKKGGIKFFFIFLFIVLILAGAAYAGYYYYDKFFNKPRKIEEKEEIPRPFIFSDEIRPVYLSNSENLTDVIREIYAGNYKSGGFIYFPIIENKKTISSREFLNELKIKASDDFLKSVENEFIFNILTDKDKNSDLVFAFKIKNYEGAFSSLFEWEKTILSDLTAVLPDKTTEQINLSGNSTSTALVSASSSKAINLNQNSSLPFYDKIIDNIDTRIVKSPLSEKIIFIYGFFGEKFLIISTSEDAFKNAVNRLKISLK